MCQISVRRAPAASSSAGHRGGRVRGVCGLAPGNAGVRAHTPRNFSAPGAGREVAPGPPRRLRRRRRDAPARGAVAGGGHGMRQQRGSQSRQRSGALEPPQLRRPKARSDRPRVPARGPGDPPAPLTFTRCPGHHQPPRHPDHDGPPHTARYRGASPRSPPRAGARAGGKDSSSTTTLRPPMRSPEPTATEEPSDSQARSRATPSGPAASWRPACASSPASTACHNQKATPPSMPPTTQAFERPTSSSHGTGLHCFA